MRQLRFALLLRRDVGRDRADRLDLAGRADQRKFDAQHRAAVRRRPLALHRSFAVDDQTVGRGHVVGDGRRKHLVHRLAKGGRAARLVGGAIGEGAASVETFDDHEQGRVVHDGLELRLARAQRRVGAVALGQRAGLRPAGRRDQQPGDCEHERHAAIGAAFNEDISAPLRERISLGQ